ncbi:MAG: hypothetical protein ACLS54_12675 [Anaerostipes hadrus]
MWSIESFFYTSRIYKQKAGFIIPSFIFESYVPKNLQIKKLPDKNIEVYYPSFVIYKEKLVLKIYLAILKLKDFIFAMINLQKSIVLEKNYGHLLKKIIFMIYYIDGVAMDVKISSGTQYKY